MNETKYICKNCGVIFEAESPLECSECSSAAIITAEPEKKCLLKNKCDIHIRGNCIATDFTCQKAIKMRLNERK